MKRKGMFNIPPQLIIHAIILIACLALIVLLVGSLLSFPKDANAEGELKNFINLVKAFDNSDQDTLETYLLFDGTFLLVSFDGTTRGIGGKTLHDEGGSGVVQNTCGKKCVCAVGLEESEVSTTTTLSFPIFACEDFKKQVIVDKDIQSRIDGWIVTPSAGIKGVGEHITSVREEYGLAETPYDLLVIGAVPNKEKIETGRLVTLIKKDGRILVHSDDVGAAPEAGGEMEVELPALPCSIMSELEICRDKDYDDCFQDEGVWKLCLNDQKTPRAKITSTNPSCRPFTAPEGRCP